MVKIQSSPIHFLARGLATVSIIIERVSKKFGTFTALDNINLEIKSNRLVALLGPSGSGKTTLLRAIAGLEPPDTGKIIINGKDTTNLNVRKRNIGFVFQHYALFKHLTVRQNIAFGLNIRKAAPDDIQKRVDNLLSLIQLQGLGDRYPAQLSGGQRQRVALARALAVEPEVLLLDEPFGALDAKVRKELRVWLRQLHEEVHVTSVFVTHDQEEAMEVADEIVIFNEGKIEQVGTPDQVYDHPASAFVMSFIGRVNVLPPTSAALFGQLGGGTNGVKIFIRPHDLEILSSPNGSSIEAKVERIIHLGWAIDVELILPDRSLLIAHLNREQLAQLHLKVGEQVYVRPRDARVFA
ncbi:Sulfate/thiosulfate import ATP-binding protein CysA [Microcystis aeruginosa PCC 9443]|uniref:ABC-type quaternary amine transporter n=1 Tax=Microcystis aeruginosa PCC 9443 TaxID=1160281 RepID=I4G1Q2_MICAE|nr:Sulfate/thiosulfate import ATP-binding protein CysA [Microcystis aeruginosa PCC 9443]